jgi:hypothetical protein
MRHKCLVDCYEAILILSDELPTILQVTLQHCGELNQAFPNIVGNLGVILHCGDLSFSTDHRQVETCPIWLRITQLDSLGHNYSKTVWIVDSSPTSFEMVSKT